MGRTLGWALHVSKSKPSTGVLYHCISDGNQLFSENYGFCMKCLKKQHLWTELCIVYSVIGETLLSTTTTVPPAGREFICLYMPPLSVCGEHWEHVYAHNHWTSSTPLPWLLVLSNKPPPHLRRQEATAKLLTKVQANEKLLLNTDITLYPAAPPVIEKTCWTRHQRTWQPIRHGVMSGQRLKLWTTPS